MLKKIYFMLYNEIKKKDRGFYGERQKKNGKHF